MNIFEPPPHPLPFLTTEFDSAEEYVDSLLKFATSSNQLQTLCGGIHILDFFTRSPDLYSSIIPQEWIEWIDHENLHDILDFFLRTDLNIVETDNNGNTNGTHHGQGQGTSTPPPAFFLEYVQQVRRHCLNTEFKPLPVEQPSVKHNEHGKYVPSHYALIAGMNQKKKHEVTNFARYIASLSNYIGDISHITDFGAGANYLGRTLASEPYNQHVIAIENREHVVEGAKLMDEKVNLTERKIVRRNKKKLIEAGGLKEIKKMISRGEALDPCFRPAEIEVSTKSRSQSTHAGRGSVQYVHHQIENGDLSAVVNQVGDTPNTSRLDVEPNTKTVSEPPTTPKLMVISLHSCGNLIHHGLRTLTMNPDVHAVAMIGCCYNLATERQTPPSFKLPSLKDLPSQIDGAMAKGDPHGFPMSDRFMTYSHRPLDAACCFMHQSSHHEDDQYEIGIRLNITARMMGVQAPRNWTREDSEGFFTRHFYRALLQRLFVDKEIVQATELASESQGRSPAGTGSAPIKGTTPIVIGGLPKGCYNDFVSYVRGAVAKLKRSAAKKMEDNANLINGQQPSAANSPHPLTPLIEKKISAMSDAEIAAYETEFLPRKKNISVIWSLMAFSAQVIEALMVVDRWSWMKEQPCIGEAWVQAVFDYSISPRNMVVVGIRKREA